jgi:hypothetical protein
MVALVPPYYIYYRKEQPTPETYRYLFYKVINLTTQSAGCIRIINR